MAQEKTNKQTKNLAGKIQGTRSKHKDPNSYTQLTRMPKLSAKDVKVVTIKYEGTFKIKQEINLTEK